MDSAKLCTQPYESGTPQVMCNYPLCTQAGHNHIREIPSIRYSYKGHNVCLVTLRKLPAPPPHYISATYTMYLLGFYPVQ